MLNFAVLFCWQWMFWAHALRVCISGSVTTFDWLHDVQCTHVHGIVILLGSCQQLWPWEGGSEMFHDDTKCHSPWKFVRPTLKCVKKNSCLPYCGCAMVLTCIFEVEYLQKIKWFPPVNLQKNCSPLSTAKYFMAPPISTSHLQQVGHNCW